MGGSEGRSELESRPHSLDGQIGPDGVVETCDNPTAVCTEFASEDGAAFEAQFDEGPITRPAPVAEAIAVAVSQQSPTTASGIDVYRRDTFGQF